MAKHRISTPAQREARKRNWRIYNIHKMINCLGWISNDRIERIIRIFDEELIEMGARPHFPQPTQELE